MTGECLLFILSGFLLGSVMFSRVLPKLLCGKDVCALGADGNPGAYNVFALCGRRLGCACLLLDILKGYAPVHAALGRIGAGSLWFAVVMLAPVLGHALAPFDRFRGGKCISTAFGAVLALIPVTCAGLVLAGAYALTSTLVRVDPHWRRTIVSFSAFAAAACPMCALAGLYPIGMGCAAISSVVILKHLRPMLDARRAARQRRPGGAY